MLFLLQANLSVGDLVKCCIKKITYFGIFVEVNEWFVSLPTHNMVTSRVFRYYGATFA